MCEMEMNVNTQIQNLTDESFQSVINNAVVPVLVDFWAPWCKPCVALNPIMEQLAGDYAGRAIVAKVNYDECPNIVAQFGIRGVPNVMLFVNGEKKAGMLSVQPKSSYVRLLDNALIKSEDSQTDTLADMLNDRSYRETLLTTGDLDDLQEAIKCNPEIVSVKFENGMTPIAAVMRRKDTKRIEIVLSANPELTVRELAGLGRLEVLQVMISKNPDLIDKSDVDGETPLSMAVRHGHLHCVESLLESGANPEGDVDLGRHTPLAMAVVTGNLEAVKCLVKHGADVNAKTWRGQTVLHIACNGLLSETESAKDIIEFLLENNINVSAVDDTSVTAIESVQKRLSRYVKDGTFSANTEAKISTHVNEVASLLSQSNRRVS